MEEEFSQPRDDNSDVQAVLRQFALFVEAATSNISRLNQKVFSENDPISPKSVGSEETKKDSELPPHTGDKPEDPKRFAGKANDADLSELLHNLSLAQTRQGKLKSERRTTLLDRVQQHQEETANEERGVMRVVNLDYSDLPQLPKLTHPNQLIRFAREAHRKLVEKKATFNLGTCLGREVMEALYQDNVDVARVEEILLMPFVPLLEKLHKLIRPKTPLQAIKWLKEVNFPGVVSGEIKSTTNFDYLQKISRGFAIYRDDFKEMIVICSKYSPDLIPSSHLKDDGLLGIFLNGIPDRYGWTIFNTAQDQLRRDAKDGQVKLEYKGFDAVADAMEKILRRDLELMTNAQAANERIGTAMLHGRTSTSQGARVTDKLAQYNVRKKQIFGQTQQQRVHQMSVDYGSGDISAIEQQLDEEMEAENQEDNEIQFPWDEQSERGNEEASVFQEQDTPLDGGIINYVNTQSRPSQLHQGATPNLHQGDKRDYNRNLPTDRKNIIKAGMQAQSKDKRTQPCFGMMTRGQCQKASCDYSHDPAVLEREAQVLMDSMRAKPWLRSGPK